jgi:hypothetical protein
MGHLTIDIIQAGTDLAEFYRLSQAALALPKVQVGALSLDEATAITDRPNDDDVLACGFVHIGVWASGPHGMTPERGRGHRRATASVATLASGTDSMYALRVQP